MIRWNYLIPRAGMIVAAAIFLRIAAGPLCSAMLVRTIDSITGAEAEISDLNLQLFPPRMTLSELSLIKPEASLEHIKLLKNQENKPSPNLMAAERIDLLLNSNSLLHRQFVIDSAEVSGVFIDSDRANPAQQKPVKLNLNEKAMNYIPSTLINAAETIHSKTKEKLKQLEVTETSRRLEDQWRKEFASLQIEIDQLKRQTHEILASAKQLDNPLRDLKQVESSYQQMQVTQDQLSAIRQRLDSLPKRIQQDYAQLQQAKQNDLSSIKSAIPNCFLSDGELNRDLVGDTVAGYLTQAKEFVEHGETLANYTVIPPKSPRLRGETYLFPSHKSELPLLRQCELSGQLTHHGEKYQLTAQLENANESATNMSEPLRIKISLRGKDQIRMEYAAQRRGNKSASQLTMHWPASASSEVGLGGIKTTGIHWTARSKELWLQIRKEETTGDEILYSGRMISKQQGTNVRVASQESATPPATLMTLQDQLASVDEILFDVKFNKPGNEQWAIEVDSNLGGEIRKASTQALSLEATRAKDQLIDEIQATYEREFQELKSMLVAKQKEVSAAYDSTQSFIGGIKKTLLPVSTDAQFYLSRMKGNLR